MDKTTKFTPSRDEANKLAEDYWKDLSTYSEKKLDELSEIIKCNAKLGKHKVTTDVLISQQEYIKSKLEDVGYKVEISENNDKYNFMYIIF
ncbi:hypothetical protein [Clostridium perfringens]|uniref:hypothetical protein n=1 Tax=Clostridium perfringens TaxID=1502 RepID=UPI0023426642|nr:hypothetical protein [Clostridium perfringens]MDC4246250.1 hypothetical protein [Clostridium perfringens]